MYVEHLIRKHNFLNKPAHLIIKLVFGFASDYLLNSINISAKSDTAILSNLSWTLINFLSFAIKLQIGFQYFTPAVSLIFGPSLKACKNNASF